MGLDFALLFPICSLEGGAGRHVQTAVSASCLGLGHLLLVTVGGVRGEQQPNLLHCAATQQSPAPLLSTLCLPFQRSVNTTLHRGLAFVPAAAPTVLLGEPLLCFCLLCVCALPFSPSPQESLCNMRQQQQKEKSKKQTLKMKP